MKLNFKVDILYKNSDTKQVTVNGCELTVPENAKSWFIDYDPLDETAHLYFSKSPLSDFVREDSDGFIEWFHRDSESLRLIAVCDHVELDPSDKLSGELI